MNWLTDLSALNGALVSGIGWISIMFVWLLRKFICSYNKNTMVMTEVGKTLNSMDQKLNNANNVDREILVELARLRKSD